MTCICSYPLRPSMTAPTASPSHTVELVGLPGMLKESDHIGMVSFSSANTSSATDPSLASSSCLTKLASLTTNMVSVLCKAASSFFSTLEPSVRRDSPIADRSSCPHHGFSSSITPYFSSCVGGVHPSCPAPLSSRGISMQTLSGVRFPILRHLVVVRFHGRASM